MAATTSHLETKIDNVAEAIREIKKDLSGNGQPGIEERLTRLEEIAKVTSSNVDASIKAAKTTNDSVSNLAAIVNKHVGDRMLHSPIMFTEKGWLTIAILLFVVLHFLIENGSGLIELILGAL